MLTWKVSWSAVTMTTQFIAMLSNYTVGSGRTSLVSHVSSFEGVFFFVFFFSVKFPNGKQKQAAVTREIPETWDVVMQPVTC